MNSNNKIDSFLLEVLVCPECKGDLIYDQEENLLVCVASKLAYQIKDGVPIMMIDEAVKLSEKELKKYD